VAQQWITEPAREVPVLGSFDVVVLGGGPAGISAAVAAGRAGCDTLLVERYGFLGGMGTAAGVTNFCGLHACVHGEHRQVVHGVADRLLAGIDRRDGLCAPHLVLGKVLAQAYDIPAYQAAADALLAESGARVLFHAQAAGVVPGEPGRIDALLVETKSGRHALRGRMFIDCSGDADLAAWAGAPCVHARDEGAMLYPTTMFRLAGIDAAAAGEIWREVPRLMAAAEAAGTFHFPRRGAVIRAQKHPSEWRVNLTQLANPDGSAVDGLDVVAVSTAEAEGRRQAFAALPFLRTLPGFADAYIVAIGPQLGIRETRRLLGDYRLSEEDVLGCASFSDSIGVNSWPIENHARGEVVYRWQQIPASRGYNQLPFRMLLPPAPDNLLVAGRCASMTHGGQSAARVSGACFVMGEAAGEAAALALATATPPRAVDIGTLQQKLRANGVWLGDEA
jgi:hypothetical protein